MRLLNNKWTALAGALAMTFALAACGGGSSPQATGPDPALTAAQTAAMAAAEAAKKASDDAAAAADAVEDNGAADPASYALARAAANDAMDAYEAAMAANEAAEAATSTADAKAAQADADAAQAKAEAALADAMKYAGMVTDAHTQMVADMERERQEAAAELAALTNARTAADTAADAAETAASSARAAVEAVMDIAGSDQGSYDTALEKAEATEAAAKAAREASDAAVRATTSADAEMHQQTAEAEKAKADTALADAMSYAGMVTQAKANADAEQERQEAEAKAAKMLADAKKTAMEAADAAMTASNMASAAVEEQRANKDLSTAAAAAFARAEDAATDAAKAAGDAAAANNAAQAATTQEDVDMYKQQAEEAKAAAELAQANAESFAGMVATVAQQMKDATEERNKLAKAKSMAAAAAKAAREAANDADSAATEAEADAPNSPAAKAARTAATAADEAADMAEAADQRAQAATDSATAMAAQLDAEAQRNAAQGALVTAKARQEEAETSRLAAEQLQEERDLAQAKSDAQALYDNATDGVLFHYNAVISKAASAETQATNARNAAMRAQSARTDYVNADEQAEMAEGASSEAQDALGRAMTAKQEADTALQAVQDATTSMAAKEALDDLKAANGKLIEEHTGDTGAGMDYMAAKEAAQKAADYANMHVVGLLKMANADHIKSALDPDANRDETEIGLIEKNRLAHVSEVNMAVKMANDDNLVATSPSTPFHGGGTVVATWDYYGDLGGDSIVSGAAAVTNDAANADTKPGEGMRMISITPTGGSTAVDLKHDDPATEDMNETNFKVGPGLGVFDEMYFGRDNDANTDGDVEDTGDSLERIILFTDLKQAKATVPAKSVSLTNEPVSMAARVTPTAAPATTGDDIHDFAGTYDHDGNPDTDAIAGTFDCVDPTTCRVQRSGTGNNGEHVTDQTKVTSISGYRFTGTGTTAEKLSMPDTSWLAFGVWLTETVDDDNSDGETINQYTFGAFADGGAAIGETGEPDASTLASVTGKATYMGKAAGVHSKAEEVNFFHADARLTADFDPPAGAPEHGTITGMIHNIMSGGESYGDDSIELKVADPGATNPTPNIVATGTFGGRARMGNTGVQDSSGEDIYRMTGGWSGAFYNHMVDNADTDVKENERAPGSVAGTFGVGRADDDKTMDVDETESFVGAFGAHCSGSNCNPH